MSAAKKTPAKGRVSNRRGSPEAIAKRRAGRAFNDLLGDGRSRRDGRSEKRRQRLLQEIESGITRGGRALKPLELVSHASELIELGEDPKTLRKLAKKTRIPEPDADLLAALAELQKAYAFPVDAYVVVGIEPELLAAAMALGQRSRTRTIPPKS